MNQRITMADKIEFVKEQIRTGKLKVSGGNTFH
jgi:anti-sigma28 factor (negative regulator of flagellin synthesis)